MRVLAFSCVHLMGREAQGNLGTVDYRSAHELMAYIKDTEPDLVINLGYFTEPFYDKEDVVDTLLPEYRQIEAIRLRGNHDRCLDLPDFVTVDGVRYEHGHKLASGKTSTRAEYIEMARKGAAALTIPIVHGHTHSPYRAETGFPLDVGSITYSQTAALIIDGLHTE